MTIRFTLNSIGKLTVRSEISHTGTLVDWKWNILR